MNESVGSVSAFAAFRADFPGVEGRVYFDVAARGLLSRSTHAAVQGYLDDRLLEGGDKAQMFATLESAREGFAKLVNAGRDEIAMTKNVSDGLNMIGMSLPWSAGDEIVLCSELEHPNNVYPWRHVARRLGVHLRDIPASQGHLPVAAMAAAINGRTRLVVVATTTFAPGYRADLTDLAVACRRHDAFLLADAVQSVGVQHTDVDALGVDGLAVSTQKGLLALYGFGFLYCRRTWAERLTPAYLARFGVDLGDAHEASLGGQDYALAPGALRFDLGNYNYAGAYAANASIEQLLALGTKPTGEYISALARELATGLLDLDLPFPSSAVGDSLGNIVTVGRIGAGQHDSADDASLNALAGWLKAREAAFSVRRGQLRFALHAYNDSRDVGQLIEWCREWRRQAA